jgi:hypothetical protein
LSELSSCARWVAVIGCLVAATHCADLVGADFDVSPKRQDASAPTPQDAGSEADARSDTDTSHADTGATEFPDADADGAICSGCAGDADVVGDSQMGGEAADTTRTPCPTLLSNPCGAALWPWGEGFVPIPYAFEPGVDVSQHNLLVEAMAEWTNATFGLVVFVPAAGHEPRALRFVDKPGCGRARRADTPLVAFAASDCTEIGTALHELGRVIGLEPTQQRADRDRYLQLADLSSFDCGGDRPTGLEIVPKCDAKLRPGGDFGVFDFRSIMLSSGVPPGGSRCGTPPPGDRLFVRRGVADTGGSSCPSDVAPDWNKTRLTPGDGAAVVELYSIQWGWSLFRSLAKDKGAEAPLDVELSPGVNVEGNPALVSLGSTRLQAFVRGSDGNVWTARVDAPSPAWKNIGAPSVAPLSDPAAVSWSQDDTHLVVIVVANETVYHRVFDGGVWRDWDSVIGAPPGNAQSAPAIASGAFETLSVFVTGDDGQIWMTELTESEWSGWSKLPLLPAGIRAAGGPAAHSRTRETRDVVVRGTDGSIYYLASSGSFSSVWTVIGVDTASGIGRPALTYDTSLLHVFVRGVEGQLWLATCLPPRCEGSAFWSRWQPLGGVLAGDPATSAPSDAQRVDVLVTSADGTAFAVPSAVKGLWHKGFPWL